MKDSLIIGSRGSRLALWQAEHIQARLAALYPEIAVRIEIIKTSGDKMQNVPLSVIGGQGVFTKELEAALLDGQVDLAVHSLKDLPTVLPEDLWLAAITEREDARDALIVNESLGLERLALKSLPHGAIIGTSSPRRFAQLKNLRPDLNIKDLRGNVDTRLRKLDEGNYDAIILAAAGLKRLGYEARVSAYLAPEIMLPAVGQGALGLEIRAADTDTAELVAPLIHEPTYAACTAERAFLKTLGGGCQLPIAAHAVVNATDAEEDLNHAILRLDGLVTTPDGAKILRGDAGGAAVDAAIIGANLATQLLDAGAADLIRV